MPSVTPDPAQCPLCGKSNLCAMQAQQDTGVKQPPCWCTNASFTEDLLARIPQEARNKACICATCAASATPA